MTYDLDMEGRAVVVTGAAGGIGRAVVHGFADAGARVCAVDLSVEAATTVVQNLANPDQHLARGVDLTNLAGLQPLLQEVHTLFGSIDALAHLAAVIRRVADIESVTEADWDAQLDVNLKTTFFLNRAAAQVMRPSGTGAIVNFSSQGWWTGGFGGSVVYAASKGGVVSLTRGLARTWAPDGIRVNCVAPGAVDTPMMHNDMTPEAVEDFLRMVPMGRMAQPEEVASAVVFLCSRRASYITGATLAVAGGQLMY